MEAITEAVSRLLAHRYEEQLLQCSLEGAHVLAECAVRRMLEAIGANSVCALDSSTTNEKIINELLENLTTIDKKLLKPLKEKKIETLEGLSWNEASVFRKPGLRTEDDEFFSGSSTRPKKYGYRTGSLQEVKAAGLHRDHHRVLPESRSYKTLPNAHMRQKTGFFSTLPASQPGAPVAPRALFGAPNASASSPALFSAAMPMSVAASVVVPTTTAAAVGSPASRQYPAPSPALAAAFAASNADPFMTPVKRTSPTVASFAGLKEEQRLYQMQALLNSMDANLALLNQQVQMFSKLQSELDSLQLTW